MSNGQLRIDRRSFGLLLGGATVMIAAAIYFGALASSCERDAVFRTLLRHPAVTSLSSLLIGACLFSISVAVVRRHWAVGVGSVVAGLYGSLWIAAMVSAATDSCVTLRPLGDAIRSRAAAGDSIFFFLEPLPAVALYAEHRIPTLRDPSARPAGTFYLVVPDSRAAEMPKDWTNSARSVFEVYGRAFTRNPMTIRLLRLPPTTESTR
jgi:hypothetical protein